MIHMAEQDGLTFLGYEKSKGMFPCLTCYRKQINGSLYKQINVVKDDGAGVSFEKNGSNQKSAFTKEEIHALDQILNSTQSTQQVEHHVSAQWKQMPCGDWYCTNCGYVMRPIDGDYVPKFCEDCGAEMEIEENQDEDY